MDPWQPTRPYRVVRRIETSDVISLVLEPADGGPLPAIAPGQYVSVFVNLPEGDRQPRQYTVSSTAVRTRLQITVRRVRGVNGAPDGRVSSYLHDQVKVGDLLDVSAPAGDFVLTPTESPLLLASAGAGITTVLPIVEHIARTQPQRTVIVAHADRRAQDHALRDTVLHLGREIDDFSSYTWYESVDDGDTRSRQGFMDLTDIPFPNDVQVFTVARCRSCGTFGRRCWRAACRRPESAMKSSDPICGPPNPRLIRKFERLYSSNFAATERLSLRASSLIPPMPSKAGSGEISSRCLEQGRCRMNSVATAQLLRSRERLSCWT